MPDPETTSEASEIVEGPDVPDVSQVESDALPARCKNNSNVRFPSDPTKYKYMISRHDQLDIHCNVFDSSFVEYFLDDVNGNFDILFD